MDEEVVAVWELWLVVGGTEVMCEIGGTAVCNAQHVEVENKSYAYIDTCTRITYVKWSIKCPGICAVPH